MLPLLKAAKRVLVPVPTVAQAPKMPLALDPSFANPLRDELTVPLPDKFKLTPALREKAPELNAKVAPDPTFQVCGAVSDTPLAMLTLPLDNAEALMPEAPTATVPPESEAVWLKITPPAVTVSLTVADKPDVLKVAMLLGPVVASQLVPVTPVQFVDELSHVPPDVAPDQVPVAAHTGEAKTSARRMMTGNA